MAEENEHKKQLYKDDSECAYLLEYLKVKDLIYDTKKGKYIIPAALSLHMTDAAREFIQNQAVHCFYVKFTIRENDSIILKFIAKNLDKGITGGYWRYGIVMQMGPKLKALVLFREEKDRIEIYFQKNEPNFSHAWALIRADIETILEELKSPPVEFNILEKHKLGHEVGIPEQDLLNLYEGGERELRVYPSTGLPLDVYKTLGILAPRQSDKERMEKHSTINIGTINNSGQIAVGTDGINQTSTVTQNYTQKEYIDDIKILLEELKNYEAEDAEWKKILIKTLDECTRFEEAEVKKEKQAHLTLMEIAFNKLKKTKDWIQIGLLPAEIATKGETMGKLLHQLKDLIF